MRKTWKFLGLLAMALAVNRGLHAQGTAFTYQGVLNDNGAPANGLYDIQFGAYDDPNTGDLLGGLVTNAAVQVSNGLFTTTIDFGPGVFTGTSLWLDIAVTTNGGTSFTSVTPRQPITPSPYAIYSSQAATALTALAVDSSTISADALNTTGIPAPGQVLGYNGSQLVWQDPVVGGSSGGWSLTGNLGTVPGTDFLGTLDSQPLELHTGGARALRLEPDPTSSGAPNVIGGSSANSVTSGMIGAAISGGGETGFPNSVTTSFGSIGGGANNIAGGQYARVGGGYQNHATGYISGVFGGAYNVASTNEAFVLGGAYNVASGTGSAIGGGGYDGSTASGNGAGGQVSFIGGGMGNNAGGYAAAIAGGFGNAASGSTGAVGGGNGNAASGNDLVVVNASPLRFAQGEATVSGGYENAATATGATVPGGGFNTAGGDFSLAAGYHATAAAAGSFVWADDSTSSTFSSEANNQFLVRASGGVGIGTSQTPPGGLRVASGGLAVTGASSPNYGTASGVFTEQDGAVGEVYSYNYGSSAPQTLALNAPGGNVGIDTASPAYTLDVNGTTRTHSIIITGGADLAEPFKMGGREMPKGSVVVIDKEHPGELALSSRAYDMCVAGIVSGANGINPGIALHQQGMMDGDQNVALSGRVYVLADAANGPIAPGDLLTTSGTPGHAMKVTDHKRAQGAIIGKAMTGLAKGRGMVLVLVTLQ
jgi:hypothetical protein